MRSMMRHTGKRATGCGGILPCMAALLRNACGYNARDELIYSRRAAESAEEYAYQYDGIGNRLTAAEILAGETDICSTARFASATRSSRRRG